MEVGLVVGNPGPPDEDLTLSLLNPEGEVLAVISKTVPVEDCCQVRFLVSQRRCASFARAGLQYPVERGQPVWVKVRCGWLQER